MVGQPGALAVQAGCIFFGASVVIPSALRPQVLRRLHQHHQGCQVCAVRQPDPPKLPMISWPLTTKPMQRIHLDFFGPMFNCYFLDMYLQRGWGEKWLPGVVVGHEGTRILTIQCPDRSVVRRHLDQVRRRSPCMDNDPRSCSQEHYISKKAALAAAEGARERLQQIPTPEVYVETPAVATINAPNQPGLASQEPRRSERLQSQNRQTPSARGARQVSVRPLVATRGGRGMSANSGRH
ncbi:hypothetical protein B566_EDAN004489 [Ephemera danica]|nr:hypothetical protein B566_EDAN004489 [Ephemera danica]